MAIYSDVDESLAGELYGHKGHKILVENDPGGVYVTCNTCFEILIGFEYPEGDDA